jgi:hypothetical protein
LQTRFNGDCAPEPLVDVGLAFVPVGDGDEFPEDEPFADTSPVISAGEARFDTGGPGKT